MLIMETIVALATPAGNSGVAVIRISGDESKHILNKLIRENIDFEPRKMYLKNVYIKDYVDKCLVVYFKAPFSFTGEDIVEIQSHGGYLLAQNIIEEALSFGARLADKGEFSKRAFINGKMSLDQAEGIIDLINAESEMQAKTGSNLLSGKLKEMIVDYQNKITDILAEIEAKLDYPEYEYSESETSNILDRLNSLISSLENFQQELDEHENNIDKATYIVKAKDIHENWHKKVKVLKCLIWHSGIKDVEIGLARVEVYIEENDYTEASAEISSLVDYLEHYSDDFSISLENIF